MLMSEPLNYSIKDALAQFDIQLEALSSGRLINDSRVLRSGDVFCAVIGELQDGRCFIDQAIDAGAACVLIQCEQAGDHGKISYREQSNQDIDAGAACALVQFYQLNQHMFALARAYYQDPQSQMSIIGITGTNGKTSTSLLIAQLFELCAQRCAVIGTVGAGRLDALRSINNTTPGASELHQLLADFARDNVARVVMEVSSHALVQQRVNAKLLDIAVFTNLSRDHLDYHQTMERYAAAKQQIFSADHGQLAVLNGDDEVAIQWLNQWPDNQPVVVYGRSKEICAYNQYVFGTDIAHTRDGITFRVDSHLGSLILKSPLMGDFNLDNLLAAIAVLMLSGCPLDDIGGAIKHIKPVIGRMETRRAKNLPTAVVDYAHTPDALKNALQACRLHCRGQLWLVFGCGGDRDKGKRPLMGRIGEQYADQLILTNDNPRNEAPQAIAQDVLAGCEQPQNVQQIFDRQQAVLTALSNAQPDDLVLLAGKGHEDYILIGEQRLDYNERQVVADFYNKKENL